jgi:hypothetical protein
VRFFRVNVFDFCIGGQLKRTCSWPVVLKQAIDHLLEELVVNCILDPLTLDELSGVSPHVENPVMKFDRNVLNVEIPTFQQITHVFEEIHYVVEFWWRIVQIEWDQDATRGSLRTQRSAGACHRLTLELVHERNKVRDSRFSTEIVQLLFGVEGGDTSDDGE